jgi:hypothetical protein
MLIKVFACGEKPIWSPLSGRKKMSWSTFAPGIPQSAWDIVRRVANCSTAEAWQEIRAPMRRQGSSLVTADEA